MEPDAYGRYPGDEMDHGARYAEIILDYFISESTTIPLLLISPPSDFDPNMSIDDDEHTPLHWACAMGRVRVVKLLLSAGADMFRVNTSGQTALMRAVMFSNNYDLRKFPELFDLLHRSILNIDRSDRTVFHHTIDLALTRGKPHAARYYLETMLSRLRDYGTQLADMLNFPDDEGETTLTMAARARSKRLVRLLLEHGADAKKRNHEGKSAEDYIVEDERFRASPPRTTGPAAAAAAAAVATTAGTSTGDTGAHTDADGALVFPPARPHVGEAARRALSQVPTIVGYVHALADAYDFELNESDRTLSQAQALQTQIATEASQSRRALTALAERAKAAGSALETSQEIRPRLQAAVRKRRGEDVARSYASFRAKIKRLRMTPRQPAGTEAESDPARTTESTTDAGTGEGPRSAVEAEPKKEEEVKPSESTDTLLFEKPTVPPPGEGTLESFLQPVGPGGMQDELATAHRAVDDAYKACTTAESAYCDAALMAQGTGPVMAAYRRLISLSCGGVPVEEVDAVVDALGGMLDRSTGDAGASTGTGTGANTGTGDQGGAAADLAGPIGHTGTADTTGTEVPANPSGPPGSSGPSGFAGSTTGSKGSTSLTGGDASSGPAGARAPADPSAGLPGTAPPGERGDREAGDTGEADSPPASAASGPAAPPTVAGAGATTATATATPTAAATSTA